MWNAPATTGDVDLFVGDPNHPYPDINNYTYAAMTDFTGAYVWGACTRCMPLTCASRAPNPARHAPLYHTLTIRMAPTLIPSPPLPKLQR